MVDEPKKPDIRDWLAELLAEILTLIVGLPIFIALIYWAFWWDHLGFWSNDIITYSLVCSENYKDGKCPGNQTKGDTITFRVRVERGEVVIMTKKGTPPLTLTKCSIFDTENCSSLIAVLLVDYSIAGLYPKFWDTAHPLGQKGQKPLNRPFVTLVPSFRCNT